MNPVSMPTAFTPYLASPRTQPTTSSVVPQTPQPEEQVVLSGMALEPAASDSSSGQKASRFFSRLGMAAIVLTGALSTAGCATILDGIVAQSSYGMADSDTQMTYSPDNRLMPSPHADRAAEEMSRKSGIPLSSCIGCHQGKFDANSERDQLLRELYR